MPRISFKKIAIVLLVIIVLSRLDKVLTAVLSIYQFFYDAFEPLRHSSVEGRFLVALSLLVLLFVTIFKLLYKQ
jgi:hypothetical protein